MAQRKHDSAGRWVELDERHAIRPEFTGANRPQWVLRFCGDFVSAHATKREAIAAGLAWEMARVERLSR